MEELNTPRTTAEGQVSRRKLCLVVKRIHGRGIWRPWGLNLKEDVLVVSRLPAT